MFLEFGRDSVTLTEKNPVRELRNDNNFRKIPLAALCLLLSHTADFLNSQLARVPITLNQQGSMEMRDELLSSVGAQNMDVSEYQVSDLKDIEFHWEDPDLNMDAVFQPGIDTTSSPSTFNDFEI